MICIRHTPCADASGTRSVPDPLDSAHGRLSYPFYTKLAKIYNSNQSRSVILCGNVYDLFYNGSEYVPLIPFLCGKCSSRGIIRVVYELNGPVRILDDREKLKNAWITWKTGLDPDTLLLRNLGGKSGPSEARARWAASSSSSCWTRSATPTWPWKCSGN